MKCCSNKQYEFFKNCKPITTIKGFIIMRKVRILIVVVAAVCMIVPSVYAKSAGDAKVKKAVSSDAGQGTRVIKQNSSGSSGARPDLKVTKLVLTSSCRIKFTMKNLSKTKITAKYHAVGKVKVSVSGQPDRTFSFSQVDPRGYLKNPMSRAVYTTGIELSGPEQVVVTVDPGDKIPESNELNNALVNKRMVPQCD